MGDINDVIDEIIGQVEMLEYDLQLACSPHNSVGWHLGNLESYIAFRGGEACGDY